MPCAIIMLQTNPEHTVSALTIALFVFKFPVLRSGEVAGEFMRFALIEY